MEAPLIPHAYQVEKIERILAEPTRAALIADQVGAGKTLVASEIALRAGWTRALFIGIGDTFGQWKATLERQSEGRITIRRLESDKAGQAVYADFLAGEPGFYFATIQWLQAQDFAYFDRLDVLGRRIWKKDKKTGQLRLKERPVATFKTKTIIEKVRNDKGKIVARIPREVEVASRAGMIGPAAEPQAERDSKQLMVFKKMCDRKRGGLDAVVFDESHIVSNHRSIGRKVITKFHGGEHNPQMWKIALSATWSGNSFENAWSAPNWLWPDLVPPYWIWREEWCATEDVYVPGKSKPVSQVTGEKVPGAWVQSLPMYTRFEVEEQAPEAIKVYVDPTPAQRTQMEDLKRDLMTWVDTQTAAGVIPLVVDVPGALYARYKQLALASLSTNEQGEVFFPSNADSAKLRVLRGILDLWPGQRVVLFTDSKLFAKLTAERMKSAGYNAIAWTGDTSKPERARIKQAFIDGEYQYIVATVQSAGTGLDGWQRVASKVVWMNLPDGDPKLFDQALGRVFRQGRTLEYGEFQHVQLIQRDSADEKILENLVSKAGAIQAAVGAHNLVAA